MELRIEKGVIGPDTAFARCLCRSPFAPRSRLNIQLSNKKKRGFYSGFCTCDRLYWILDIGDRTTEIQPIAPLSRLKTLVDLVESLLFGRVSESLRKYWRQERNYSGRSVHQLKVSIKCTPLPLPTVSLVSPRALHTSFFGS